MSKITVSDFNGIIAQFDLQEIDSIRVIKNFDYQAYKSKEDRFNANNPPDAQIHVHFDHLLKNPAPKSGRLICIQCMRAPGNNIKGYHEYYFNADCAVITTRPEYEK